MKKPSLVGILLGLFLGVGITAQAASVLFPYQGGTGVGTATAGDVGKYLKVSDDSPFTYSFDTPAGGSGGIGDPFTHPAANQSATTSLMILSGGFLSTASSTINANATTTGRQAVGYLASTGSATSTFAGDIDLSAAHSVIEAHAFIADESDGLRLENNARGLVALLGAGNGLGTTFYDGVNVTGNLSVLTGSTLTVTDITSALMLTGAGGVVAEYTGTSCTNQFVRSLSALGAATCATVGSADVAGLDISDDTNLAVTYPIILTGDTLSFPATSTLYGTGTAGQVLMWSGSAPVWAATSTSGVGTVTSVDMSVPTGLSISGNPVTTSGTLALTYTAGYAGVLTASTTNWNTFYDTPSNRITDGTGLTWSANTLNVDTSQNIATLSNLTGNGFVKTSGGTGALSVDTTTYESGLTAGDGLTRTANDFDCDTANGSTFGCLSAANWNTFNNKWDLSSTTIGVPYGGTGATTLTGLLQGNGTSPITGITGTIGQFPYYNGTNTLAATSTISIATNGALTIDNGLASDAWTTYGATSHEWSVGYDATDFSYAVASSTVLGTNNAFVIDKNLKVTVTTSLDVDTLTSALVLTGAGGDFAEYTGASCTNQFVRSLSALGAATCATVANTDLANSTISGIALGANLADLTATNSTLTFSGTYNGGTARTIGLNLASANSWTALQQFANASSTQFSAASETFYIDSAGKVAAKDTTNNWSGRISPTRSFVLGTGTTTTWTASTTGSAYSPYLVMPFTGTLRQVRCVADAAGLGVNVQVNGSDATPSYFVGSTTVGIISFTAGNTFAAGQKILANFGTTTTSTTKSQSCTFDVTET